MHRPARTRSEREGVIEIKTAPYGLPNVAAAEGNALVVVAQPGFDRSSFPAAFRGYDVVIHDTHDNVAFPTGPLE